MKEKRRKQQSKIYDCMLPLYKLYAAYGFIRVSHSKNHFIDIISVQLVNLCPK